MQTRFDLFTLRELEQAGPGFLWPNDPAQINVMPPPVWELVRSNPDHPADLPVATTLSLDGRRVVSIALVQQRLRLGNRAFPCLIGHSLYSHPDVRVGGIGGLLLRELFAALKPLRVPFAAYGATPFANKLMAALRMVVVGLAPRWVLPLRSGPIVRQRIGSGAASKVLSLAANVPLRAWAAVQRARLKPATKGYTVVERDTLTSVPEIDAPDAAPRAHFLRSPAILDWKRGFARLDTSVHARAFHVVDDSGRDVACFLLRIATHERVGQKQYRDMRICRVLDMLVPPSGEEARVALHALLRIAASERADVVELLTTDERLSALCRSIGCRQSNGYELLLTRTEGLPEEVFDIRRWFLTMIEAEAAFS